MTDLLGYVLRLFHESSTAKPVLRGIVCGEANAEALFKLNVRCGKTLEELRGLNRTVVRGRACMASAELQHKVGD
jgi:hypothetical protein